MVGGAPVGSGRAYRLDPASLPARGELPVRDAAATAFVIDRDRAVIGRAGAARTVPLAAYRGVAVRMEAVGDNGDVRAFVELLHPDPSLTLLLAMNDDPYEVAGDWQAWGHALDLPLLIIGQDGSIGEPLAVVSGVHVGRSMPRRRYSFFAKRRPRFLTRRKAGDLGRMERIAGREIIARN